MQITGGQAVVVKRPFRLIQILAVTPLQRASGEGLRDLGTLEQGHDSEEFECVDAWDQHRDALNLARLEKMRGRAVHRRLVRELARQEEAEHVADSDFRILLYEDIVAVSDWFPCKAPLVRVVARKL